MILITTDKENKCRTCAGFGVFNNDHQLDVCPKCGSVHIEMFDLTYRESKPTNLRFIKLKVPSFIERLFK